MRPHSCYKTILMSRIDFHGAAAGLRSPVPLVRPSVKVSVNAVALTLALTLVWGAAVPAATIPFTLQGPGVDPGRFRITAFATGMNYPVGMAQLADGSLLVTSTDGPNFLSSSAGLVRLVDANRDGIADSPPVTLFSGLSGGATSVRVAGSLVFVTGQGKPVVVLRQGSSPAAPLTQVGRLDITYPAGWLHPHSALAVRPTPGQAAAYDLVFQFGSKFNFAPSTNDTAPITSTGLGGFSGVLRGDTIYMLTFLDRGTTVLATNLVAIAWGLRNPSGFAFQPSTGDLYFEDNGIDGLVDVNEPTSADELNVLPAAAVGRTNLFYGYPSNYTAYRTGTVVGGQGVQPLVAFQPQPNPANGEESEGPNDICFAPPGFPDELNNGVFVGFHGKFSSGGAANEENALVFVGLDSTNYFHVTRSSLPRVGHLDGLLATADSLFISDMSTNGSLSTGTGRGVIYQVTSLVGPSVQARRSGEALELRWKGGTLQGSTSGPGNWVDITNTSPFRVNTTGPASPTRLFRSRIPR